MEPRGALPAPCLHPTCLEPCLEELDMPAPMRLPAVRAAVLFAMRDKRREGSERGKENRLARSPESQLDAVGELGGHPETPAAGCSVPQHGTTCPHTASAKLLRVMELHMPPPLSYQTQSKYTLLVCTAPPDTPATLLPQIKSSGYRV